MHDHAPKADSEIPLLFSLPYEVTPRRLTVMALAARDHFIQAVLIHQQRFEDVIDFRYKDAAKYEIEVGLQFKRLAKLYEEAATIPADTELEFTVPQTVDPVAAIRASAGIQAVINRVDNTNQEK